MNIVITGGAGFLGRKLTLDVGALLSPIGATARLGSDRAQLRCQRLVDEAMALAVESSQWTSVDGARMPRSWIYHYQTLADLDDGPALVAFIERSTAGNHAGPGLSALRAMSTAAETEIAYGIVDWSSAQLTWVTQALDHQGISWFVDAGELIVDPTAEASVDALVAQMTGERPTNMTWQPPSLSPPDASSALTSRLRIGQRTENSADAAGRPAIHQRGGRLNGGRRRLLRAGRAGGGVSPRICRRPSPHRTRRGRMRRA